MAIISKKMWKSENENEEEMTMASIEKQPISAEMTAEKKQ